jgi:single-stranded-DNA-specific exonuclease
LFQWVVAEQNDTETVNDLLVALGVSPVVAKILYNRGIRTYEQAKRFFRPDWTDLHDPFLIADMDRAVDRIAKAVSKKEKIFIYGDYDVDGITSVSLMYLFLKNLGLDVLFYIPDRLKDGYGLSCAGVEQAAQSGATLLITVDCGITAVDEIALAGSLGVDVIVSDHHEPSKHLPQAVAILDPKRSGCPYPFKELAGVGVAFKLIQAISIKFGLGEAVCQQYIDLVALGSAADIVPLADENRALVKLGLDRINQMDRVGIKALAESSGLLGKPVGTGQIVFILAPRINAVGRMGNAERAVNLLITDSNEEAKAIANVLESENRNRKSIDEETFIDAKMIIETECSLKKDRAIVLAQQGWHSGVIGIVASRIVEQYYRPTIMIAVDGDVGKGSARSIPSFDIHSALKRCEEHLIGFGGHRHAAGLMIQVEKIPAFRDAFQNVALEMLGEDELIQQICVDSEINLPEITDKFVRIINQFAPFGPKNMRPVFLSRNLQVVGSSKVVGKNHLKFKVRQGGEVYDAIGFDLGELQYRLSPGDDNLDMVYVIEENQWNGQTKVQLRVKDLR